MRKGADEVKKRLEPQKVEPHVNARPRPDFLAT